MQHFPLPRELNWGPYPPGWLLTQSLGSTGFLPRPPNGGCFLCGSLLNGGFGRGWLGTPRSGCLQLVLQESFWWGYTAQDGIIREGDIRLHHFPQLQDAPHQKAWLAWGRQVGLLHPELEGLCITHCFLQLLLSDIPAGELWIWWQEKTFWQRHGGAGGVR